MRKYGILLIFILLSLGVNAPKTVVNELARLDSQYLTQLQEISKLEEENQRFTTALGVRESGMRATICNEIGAMGIWQFMPGTLKDLGFGHITERRFRANPNIFPIEVQRQALSKKMALDLEQLEDQWFRSAENDVNYLELIGDSVGDVKITKAGLLAAAHIGGVYGTMRMLDKHGKYNPRDIFGTSILDYLSEFSEYSYTNEEEIINRRKCTEQSYVESKISILLSRLSKLSATEHRSKDMVIAMISKLTQRLTSTISLTKQHSTGYRWDLKQLCLNITGQCLPLGVLQLSDIISGQLMDMAKLNGTIAKSGMDWFMDRRRKLSLPVQDYINSTLNLFGMRHGGLSLLTYLRNLRLSTLINLKQLAQV